MPRVRLEFQKVVVSDDNMTAAELAEIAKDLWLFMKNPSSREPQITPTPKLAPDKSWLKVESNRGGNVRPLNAG